MNLQENIRRIKQMMGMNHRFNIVTENTQSEYTIRKYRDSDKDQVQNLVIKEFSRFMDKSVIPYYLEFATNYNKSIVVEKNDTIVGVYLLGDRQIKKGIRMNKSNKIFIDLDEYDNKVGLEGVALVVDESERGKGLGSKLKDYTKTLGVDYIWGGHYEGLNNLNDWLKRRRIAAENDKGYITIEDL
jgi:GNAT superfamily N-acetyltransferase